MSKTKTKAQETANLEGLIEHREKCPELDRPEDEPTRVESFVAAKPGGYEVQVARCMDCGQAAYGEPGGGIRVIPRPSAIKLPDGTIVETTQGSRVE
jgi:hypothetical protein